jgi:hypothetical protein
MIVVNVLPPSESWRRRVSLDYRKGAFLCLEERQLITLPRVVNDRLMFLS